jgi:hypothetical protein
MLLFALLELAAGFLTFLFPVLTPRWTASLTACRKMTKFKAVPSKLTAYIASGTAFGSGSPNQTNQQGENDYGSPGSPAAQQEAY